MQPFFIEDNFYIDIESYLIDADLEKEDIQNLPDDYKIKVELCDLEPIVNLTASYLTEIIVENNEERLSEDGDVYGKIEKALSQCINFETLNAAMPRLWYPNGKDGFITKADLLNAAQ